MPGTVEDGDDEHTKGNASFISQFSVVWSCMPLYDCALGAADEFSAHGLRLPVLSGTAKLEEQRILLLQRRLADSEKQTKLLINRLSERNSTTHRGQSDISLLPPKGATAPGPSSHAPGAGHAHANTSLRPGRGDRVRKNQFEQALLDGAARAKQRVKDNQSANGREHSPDSGPHGVSREVSRVLNARSERAGGSRSHRGRASATGSESQDGSGDGDGSLVDGYSKSAALDSIERGPSESDLIAAVGKKGRDRKGRQKSEKDLPSVDENRRALGRTASGTEIDLETGLPKEQAKSTFSWFYAISFVILIIALVYASIIILNRYT